MPIAAMNNTDAFRWSEDAAERLETAAALVARASESIQGHRPGRSPHLGLVEDSIAALASACREHTRLAFARKLGHVRSCAALLSSALLAQADQLEGEHEEAAEDLLAVADELAVVEREAEQLDAVVSVRGVR